MIAALPREVAGLVRGVGADRMLRSCGIYLYKLRGAVVVCAGMGGARATEAVRTARAAAEISMLVSAGLAGGCDPGVGVGEVIEPATVIDALSGARHLIAGGRGTLVTTHTVAGVKEKARLFGSYGAAVVDMEAATVARLAEMNGVPFRAVKAVSDGHDFELASLSRFATAHGHFRTGAFALHTALRPGSWRGAMQLGEGSQRALRGLAAALKEICGE